MDSDPPEGCHVKQDKPTFPSEVVSHTAKNRTVIILIVAIILLLVVISQLVRGSAEPVSSADSRADAVAAYEEALDADRPIYVIFHSLTCEPCITMMVSVGEVMPEYSDRVTLVDVLSDTPSGIELAGSFGFQFIPTSFFLAPDGTVLDSYTGAMSAEELRARLDALLDSAS